VYIVVTAVQVKIKEARFDLQDFSREDPKNDIPKRMIPDLTFTGIMEPEIVCQN